MKKLVSMFSILMMLVTMATSCSNSTREDFLPEPEMVTVSLDCSFSGNTTRATENALYNQLYSKIITKELVADTYFLTFTEKTTKESFVLIGNWSRNTLHSIKPGTYKVVGSSTASGDGLQEKCSISFDTEVVVSPNASRITLNAKYDCFAFLFDKSVVKDAYITYLTSNSALVEKHFFEMGNLFYGFSRGLYNKSDSRSQKFTVKYNNETVEMQSYGLQTKTGEYYLFDVSTMPNTIYGNVSGNTMTDHTANFTIDRMVCGKL